MQRSHILQVLQLKIACLLKTLRKICKNGVWGGAILNCRIVIKLMLMGGNQKMVELLPEVGCVCKYNAMNAQSLGSFDMTSGIVNEHRLVR